ncbi:MAG: argininosuccinate lyase [Desulfobacterales bacterium]|jgi:argininosuccinate lyase
MTQKAWDGRFAEQTDQTVEAFTASIAIDRRLYRHDIDGSIAHCRMLAKAGIISRDDAAKLVKGLDQIRAEIEKGQFVFADCLEDIHMHIEDRLAAIVGRVARKLHTARSRNDQVALDARLYLREETGRILDQLRGLRQAFVDAAREHVSTVMPGYTHMQRAQPVLLGHHLLAYYEMFTRDSARFRDALNRINVMPLGCAALAGTTYPIDRDEVANQLGFAEIAANSMDAVADRDFMLEFVSAASIAMVHLSRLSEELVLWASSEFGFIEMPDAFSTGSSIMPQKKNPDVPELIRGKTGRVFGDLVALLTTMKALPLAYNRDMQEDKGALFSTVDTLQSCIEVMTKMLPQVWFNKDRMRQATTTGFLNATDMADYLVGRGIPFREAHAVVGRAVAYALDQGRELDQLTLAEMRTFSEVIDEALFEALAVEQVVNRRTSKGGTAEANVRAAVQRAADQLATEQQPPE